MDTDQALFHLRWLLQSLACDEDLIFADRKKELPGSLDSDMVMFYVGLMFYCFSWFCQSLQHLHEKVNWPVIFKEPMDFCKAANS